MTSEKDVINIINIIKEREGLARKATSVKEELAILDLLNREEEAILAIVNRLGEKEGIFNGHLREWEHRMRLSDERCRVYKILPAMAENEAMAKSVEGVFAMLVWLSKEEKEAFEAGNYGKGGALYCVRCRVYEILPAMAENEARMVSLEEASVLAHRLYLYHESHIGDGDSHKVYDVLCRVYEIILTKAKEETSSATSVEGMLAVMNRLCIIEGKADNFGRRKWSNIKNCVYVMVVERAKKEVRAGSNKGGVAILNWLFDDYRARREHNANNPGNAVNTHQLENLRMEIISVYRSLVEVQKEAKADGTRPISDDALLATLDIDIVREIFSTLISIDTISI